MLECHSGDLASATTTMGKLLEKPCNTCESRPYRQQLTGPQVVARIAGEGKVIDTLNTQC